MTGSDMDLSVIIVNWNSGPLLRQCLDALPGAAAGISYEVFVVDNASTDDSVALAQPSPQAFHLTVLPKNSGFARANNVALRGARGKIVLLLNPDTEPFCESLQSLIRFFDTHPRAGVVGGRLLYPDGTVQQSVRTFPTPLVLALLLTRLARAFPNLPAYRRHEMAGFPHDRAEKVDQVMGAFFAIRRDVLGRVGLLDEGYWIWFEEVDFCRRTASAGWEVWFTPSAAAIHHRAAAFRQVSSLWRARRFSRSALRYARKHFGLPVAASLSLLVPVHLATAALATLLQAPPSVLRRQGTAEQ